MIIGYFEDTHTGTVRKYSSLGLFLSSVCHYSATFWTQALLPFSGSSDWEQTQLLKHCASVVY